VEVVFDACAGEKNEKQEFRSVRRDNSPIFANSEMNGGFVTPLSLAGAKHLKRISTAVPDSDPTFSPPICLAYVFFNQSLAQFMF